MKSDHILLVEPTTLYKQIVTTIARTYHIDVERVSCAARALDCLTNAQPWILVTSQELPDLAGTSLIAALESSAQYRAIPKVLLSSTENYPTTLYPPRHVCLKNPELPKKFDALLSEFRGDPTERRSDDEVVRGARILLAEDTASLQMLYDKFLHLAGAIVTVASDGREAIEILSNQATDLVLMDIEMPEVDGWTATRALREAGFSKPIVALSAHDSAEFAKQALGAGFNGSLVKPMNRATLVSNVASYLQAVQ